MNKFQFKQEGEYPRPDQLEYLQLAYERFVQLASGLQYPQNELREDQKFYYLKEVLSLFTELEKYPPIGDALNNLSIDHPLLKFKPLFRAIRNLLAHFPFFNTWDEVKFNKRLVNCMPSASNSIDRYFSDVNYPHFNFRFVESQKGEIVEGRVSAPIGYVTEKTIFLKDIISCDDAIALIIGYSILFLSSALEGNKLNIL